MLPCPAWMMKQLPQGAIPHLWMFMDNHSVSGKHRHPILKWRGLDCLGCQSVVCTVAAFLRYNCNDILKSTGTAWAMGRGRVRNRAKPQKLKGAALLVLPKETYKAPVGLNWGGVLIWAGVRLRTGIRAGLGVLLWDSSSWQLGLLCLRGVLQRVLMWLKVWTLLLKKIWKVLGDAVVNLYLQAPSVTWGAVHEAWKTWKFTLLLSFSRYSQDWMVLGLFWVGFLFVCFVLGFFCCFCFFSFLFCLGCPCWQINTSCHF